LSITFGEEETAGEVTKALDKSLEDWRDLVDVA
jgi:hypothetical protein